MTSECSGPERELERVLAGLQPSRPGLDHDLVMFRAGRAAIRRRLRVWQGCTVALLAALGISIYGGLSGLRSRGPESTEPRWTAVAPPESPGPGSYAALRSRVLRDGIEVLPLPEGRGETLSAQDATNL